MQRFVIGLVASGLIACANPGRPSGPNAPGEELAANRQQFQQKVGESYRVTAQNNCFCPPEVLEPVRLTVTNGSITAAARLSDGTPLPPTSWPAYRTIEQVFSEIQKGITTGAQRIQVDYDHNYGYPRDVLIDYQMAADNFIGVNLSNLEVLR